MTKLPWSQMMTWYADPQDFLDRCADTGEWQTHNAIVLAYNQGRHDERMAHGTSQQTMFPAEEIAPSIRSKLP